MNRCIIITAWIESTVRESVALQPQDFILCADGGYAAALAEDISPDLVLGDFDSLRGPCPPVERCIEVSAEKDDTDTMLCVKHGMAQGFRDFVIIGGLGGRLDHTMANLQAMSWCLDHEGHMEIADGKNRARLIAGPCVFSLSRPEPAFRFFSLFSWTESCSGVTLENALYPLHDATLTQSFPVGVSNEFAGEPVAVHVKRGKLLIILSRD